jgi:hypothetical protein
MIFFVCVIIMNAKSMASGAGSSMLYSFLLFTVILSLQEMYRSKLASTELFTILGGFISSLLFLVLLTVSFFTIFLSWSVWVLWIYLFFYYCFAVNWEFSGNMWHEDWVGCWWVHLVCLYDFACFLLLFISLFPERGAEEGLGWMDIILFIYIAFAWVKIFLSWYS